MAEASKQAIASNATVRALGFALRRFVVILIGFVGLAVYASTLRLDAATSLSNRRPVRELVAERQGTTIALFAQVVVVALITALIILLIGRVILGLRGGLLGALLHKVGVVGFAALASVPPLVLGLWIVVQLVQSRTAPAVGVNSPGPLLMLFPLPAILAANAGLGMWARAMEADGASGSEIRRLLAAVCWVVASLAGMTGGLLSALIIAENIFAVPGLGRLFLQATLQRDNPLVAAAAISFVNIGLIGLLLAGLFHSIALWLAPGSEAKAEEIQSSRWLPLAVLNVLLAGAAIVVVLIGFGALGLIATTGARYREASIRINPQEALRQPDAAHPWGTDALGRDVQARALVGFQTTFGLAVSASVLPAILAIVPGLLAGGLYRRRHVLWDSVADLLMLPFTLPLAIPGLVLLVVMLSTLGFDALVTTLGILALARGAHAAVAIWRYKPAQKVSVWVAVVLIPLLIMLATTVLNITMLGFIGLGVRPPTPELGEMIAQSISAVVSAPYLLLYPSLMLFATLAVCVIPVELLSESLGIRTRDALPWYAS